MKPKADEPILPGWQKEVRRDNYALRQTFQIQGDQAAEAQAEPRARFVPKSGEPDNPKHSADFPTPTSRTAYWQADGGEGREAVWLRYGSLCLRFRLARSAGDDSGAVLTFWPGDGSLEVLGSGDGGKHVLLGRQPLVVVAEGDPLVCEAVAAKTAPNAPSQGRHVDARDLRVGSVIELAGRVFSLADADVATREWYAKEGMPQGRATEEPATDAPGPSRDLLLDAVVREELSGKRPAPRPGPDEVARFEAYLEERLEGALSAVRLFAVTFFESDGTLEVRERGAGLFAKRARVPLDRHALQGSAHLHGRTLAGAPLSVTLDHLDIGKVLRVADHNLVLCDADDGTRARLRRSGRELAPKMPIPTLKATPAPKKIQEVSGGGAAAALHGSAANRAWARAPAAKGARTQPLTWACTRTGLDRRWELTLWLGDGTVGISEPALPNSGVDMTKVLARGPYLHVSGRPFELGDMISGARLQINDLEVVLGEPVAGTAAFLETYAKGDPTDLRVPAARVTVDRRKLTAALEKVRWYITGRNESARAVFRRHDLDRNGVLTVDELEGLLSRLSFDLNSNELLVVLRTINEAGDGKVTQQEFYKAFGEADLPALRLEGLEHMCLPLDGLVREQPDRPLMVDGDLVHDPSTHYGTGNARYGAPVVEEEPAAPPPRWEALTAPTSDYALLATRELTGVVRRREGRLALETLRDRFQRARSLRGRAVAECAHRTIHRTLPHAQIAAALGAVGVTVTADEIQTIAEILMPGCGAEVDYVQFFAALSL